MTPFETTVTTQVIYYLGRVVPKWTCTTSSKMSDQTTKHVAVIGGGLVGALNACFMAKRGFKVDLFEKRDDIRTMEVVRGRSINLALSVRGREALREVGLEEMVIKEGIKMYARMIHSGDGALSEIMYGRKDQYIMSVDRRKLNEVLLTAAEKYPNVQMHFGQRMMNCNIKTGDIEFKSKTGETTKMCVDLIIGNDGAFSSVRQQMMKDTLLNYEQTYIPHGYMELYIPPNSSGQFNMDVNYLHIWPRNEFMMIALPNQDKSFTATLFMPFDIFNGISTGEEAMVFFREKFQDSIPLIGEEAIKETFRKNKALPMVSIKCSPYHFGGKTVIMGDAAHAMVPFYGQGMNAGFEDCIVFNDKLNEFNNDFDAALKAYTEYRKPDAQAINDLAMYNYIEMRKSVNSKMFLLRKKLDNFLYKLFPNSWIPLYTMVSFSRTRYHECIKRREWQDQMLTKSLNVGCVVLAMSFVVFGRHMLMKQGSFLMNLTEDLTGNFKSMFGGWVQQ